jgi:acyl-CoA thioesterase
MNIIDSDLEVLVNDFNNQGYCQLLGIKVISLEKGMARLSLSFKENILNKHGVDHGGIITSLADSAAAVALLSIIGPEGIVSGIELKINFLHSVKNGDLLAEAKVIHKGSRTAVVEVDIRNKDERLVGKCLLTFMVIKEDTNND